METSIHIRNAKAEDLPGIMRVESAEYGPIGWVAPIEVFEHRLRHCYFREPGDLFWIAEENEEIKGYITGLLINFDPGSPPRTREEAIGYDVAKDGKEYGFGTRHNPEGNALYVMSIGVSERGRRIASRLIQATIDFVQQNDFDFRVAGLRSDYAQGQHSGVTPEEYVRLRRKDGQFIDGLMRLYARLGFEELWLKKDYAPEDTHGEGWGNFMIWRKKNV
ncbi:GNAT family N-acetyltransferase [Candidatus Woesearchaeota archaeon]|nr:GNAT family N-acetyltransferase [Candidatus Woesearchaeota archaeon]